MHFVIKQDPGGVPTTVPYLRVHLVALPRINTLNFLEAFVAIR